METTSKNSKLSINNFKINFPTSNTCDLLYVYTISNLKNIYHITHDIKFNKLL